MNMHIKDEEIIIDFNKMNEIGSDSVFKINDTILNTFKVRFELAEKRNKELIDYALKRGNIVLENKEDIIKRNEGIVKYIINCEFTFSWDENEEEMIKRFKEIIDIRNNVKKDWCLHTD